MVVGDPSLTLRMTKKGRERILYFAPEGTPHFAVACKNKHKPTTCNDEKAKYRDSLRTCSKIPHFGMTEWRHGDSIVTGATMPHFKNVEETS